MYGGLLTSSRGEAASASAARSPHVQVWQAYLAFGALFTALYMLVPPFKGNALLINALGLASWVAVLVGIRRNRPSYKLPWFLFAFGLCLYWLGDLYTYSYPKYILHHEVPFPSIGDAIYLSVYPALMLGLLLLVRRRSPRSSRNTLIDAAILTLGLSLLSWILLITPYLHDATMGLLPKLVSVAYPLGDILLLAAAIRLVLDSGPRRPAFYLLSASIVSLLVTDFVYGVMILDESFHHQLLLDLGWIAYLLLWGAAALHPSMAELDKPVSEPPEARLTRARLALLTGASLIAPMCILLKELHRNDVDLIVIVCASMVLFGLVVMRMADLVRQQERSVKRERLLSSFGTALVSCATREEMQHVALEAAARLLERRGAAFLCVTQDGALSAAGLGDDAEWPSRTLATHVSRPLLEIAAPGVAQEAELDPALLAALDLPGELHHGAVLALPVRGGAPQLLLLALPTAPPRQLREALKALGTQLALALEGARLSEKIHLQRSEARFASLVQHGNLDYVIAWRSKYPVGRGLVLWHGYVIPILMKAFPHTPVIRSIEVLQEFRGAGIGTAIVHELERRASERGYTQISLGVMPENVRARKLWHRLGYVDWDGGAFEAVSTYEGPHGKTVTREERFIPMRKQLLDGCRPVSFEDREVVKRETPISPGLVRT